MPKSDLFQSVTKVKQELLAQLGILATSIGLSVVPAWSSTNVYLTGVPDYGWYYGCMGTSSGNLMGFWDRHGFPEFYTGLVNNGVAPLNTWTTNLAITSLWVSKAGLDGRPANKPGHADDYYSAYESTGADPYLTVGRPEHTPDCIGDFIGLDQKKWTNMANECNGNIDGYCFVYWNTNGDRRVNFVPTDAENLKVPDVQSGLRAWTQYRGCDCEVFTQLADFNPNTPPGGGFTFADLKAEIDSGYPVLLFMQNYNQTSRTIGSVTHVNPPIHSMLAYGYYLNNDIPYVRYRTSWASGNNSLHAWNSQIWEAAAALPVRGVVGFHPVPKLKRYAIAEGNLSLEWDGPGADLYDSTLAATNRVHGYFVEMSPSLATPGFTRISPLLLQNSYTVTNCPSPAFFRLSLVKP